MAFHDYLCGLKGPSFIVLTAMFLMPPGKSSSQSTGGSKSTQAATSAQQSAPLTAEEKEAQFHYKVAVTALKNNDLEIAAKELETAAKLAPNNALVQYNLAVVKSKNHKPAEALVNLKRAMDLGLPSAEASQADDLLVQLTYQAQKSTPGVLSWLKGTWIARFKGQRYLLVDRPGHYEVRCEYPMTVTSTLAVASDPEHPDLSKGTLTFHLQGNTNYSLLVFYNGNYHNDRVDICLSNYGETSGLSEDATFEVSKVTRVGEQANVEVNFLQCRGYCRDWTSTSFGLLQLDEAHLKHTAPLSAPANQDHEQLFGTNVQLVLQGK